jgi:hypothetical protein
MSRMTDLRLKCWQEEAGHSLLMAGGDEMRSNKYRTRASSIGLPCLPAGAIRSNAASVFLAGCQNVW